MTPRRKPVPLPFPERAMQDSGAILGKKGSGKSSVGRLLLEHELDLGHRCVLVDPGGDSPGIKLTPDSQPSRFGNVLIFGGPHADIPISQEDGRKCATIIAKRNVSCIFDLSGMYDTHQRTFMAAFADELYEAMLGGGVPMLLMVDEAHEFAPQEKGTVSGVLLNRMRRLTTQGRKRGIYLWVMTQRPARIDKTLLSQTETLVGMKIGIKHDADAITDWLELHIAERAAEVRSQLSALKPGEGFVSYPAKQFFERIAFPLHSTLDTGRTPQHGETVGGVDLPKGDVGDLAQLFGAMETGDPRDDEIKSLKDARDDALRRLTAAREDSRREKERADAASLALIDVRNRIGMVIGSPRIEPIPLGYHIDDFVVVLGNDGVARPHPREGDDRPALADSVRRIGGAKPPQQGKK